MSIFLTYLDKLINFCLIVSVLLILNRLIFRKKYEMDLSK